MNDKTQYLAEILQRRPDLSESILVNYLSGLDSFLTSQRYLVMKPLQLQRFLGSALDPSHSLATITLGELADYDLTELCLVHGINSEALESLGRFLTSLGQQSSGAVEGEVFMDPVHSVPLGAEEMPIPAGWQPPAYRVHEHTATKQGLFPELSSVEEERLLREALDEVRNHPHFDAISGVLVGDSWNEEYGRAPFVTVLNWSQLLGMSLPDLMHKHYYTVRVSLGIIAAAKAITADKAYQPRDTAGHNSSAKPTNLHNSPIEESTLVHDYAEPTLQGYPDVFTLMLLPVRQYLQQMALSEHPMQLEVAKAFTSVPEEDLLIAILLGDLGICGIVEDMVGNKERQAAILSDLNGAIARHAPKMTTLLKSILAAPVIHEDRLVYAIFGADPAGLVQRSLTRAICFSIGGERPNWLGVTLQRYWTMVPETFVMVMEKIVSTAPCSFELVKDKCGKLMPDVPMADIEELLRRSLRRDEASGTWVLLN